MKQKHSNKNDKAAASRNAKNKRRWNVNILHRSHWEHCNQSSDSKLRSGKQNKDPDFQIHQASIRNVQQYWGSGSRGIVWWRLL